METNHHPKIPPLDHGVHTRSGITGFFRCPQPDAMEWRPCQGPASQRRLVSVHEFPEFVDVLEAGVAG